jgi:adenylate kinase family enzyme
MRRIAVIGNAGSGKTTFATELGARLGLPVINLDREYWQPGWLPTPRERWRVVHAALVRPQEWIIEGNYGSTLEVRVAAADTVFFLDLPARVCLIGVLRRWARHHGKAVQADGCPERVDWTCLRCVWRYRRASRPNVLAQLRAHPAGTRVVVIRSRREAHRVLAGVADQRATRPPVPATAA